MALRSRPGSPRPWTSSEPPVARGKSVALGGSRKSRTRSFLQVFWMVPEYSRGPFTSGTAPPRCLKGKSLGIAALRSRPQVLPRDCAPGFAVRTVARPLLPFISFIFIYPQLLHAEVHVWDLLPFQCHTSFQKIWLRDSCRSFTRLQISLQSLGQKVPRNPLRATPTPDPGLPATELTAPATFSARNVLHFLPVSAQGSDP